MNSLFQKGLNPEEVKELKAQIEHSLLSKKLHDYLAKELEQISSLERSSKQFNNPNWAFEQAYRNGEMTKLTQILKLLGE